MARPLHLSEEDIIRLKGYLQKAEPYDDDDPILNTLCGGISTIFNGTARRTDPDRFNATMAKKFLAQYEREQREKREKEKQEQNNG